MNCQVIIVVLLVIIIYLSMRQEYLTASKAEPVFHTTDKRVLASMEHLSEDAPASIAEDAMLTGQLYHVQYPITMPEKSIIK